MDEYFDLTESSNDINLLMIVSLNSFNCSLRDTTLKTYKGFILSKSPKGNNFVICDTEFQKSATDSKYQPRLVFRKVDSRLMDKRARSDVDHIRIPFLTGEDGYRQFWKMVFFLYKFKELIDFGNFDGSYQLITAEQLKTYLNDTQNLKDVQETAKDLNIEVSGVLKSATTLNVLKTYRTKISEFIKNNNSETEVQNWLDEDGYKYRQSRCAIFGIEFVEFKREGSSSSKRFDILTRVGASSLERVLIELKSPSDDIFDVAISETINDQSGEYKLHNKLSRAIPQILGYREDLNDKEPGDAELEKVGINEGKANIGKCIIIIGKDQVNDVWRRNRNNLMRVLSSSLEIWTYTDLYNKLDATINNLENSLQKEDSQ